MVYSSHKTASNAESLSKSSRHHASQVIPWGMSTSGVIQRPSWWLSARLWYLLCISNRDTTVLQKAIKILWLFDILRSEKKMDKILQTFTYRLSWIKNCWILIKILQKFVLGGPFGPQFPFLAPTHYVNQWRPYSVTHIDGLVQDCSSSSALVTAVLH